jgi:hypothetical protein
MGVSNLIKLTTWINVKQLLHFFLFH